MHGGERVELDGRGEQQRAARAPAPASHAIAPLGRVVAVSGSQATLHLTADLLSDQRSGADVTVGSLLGIDTGTSLAIGALCDLSLAETADTAGGAYAIARVDLIGEIRQSDAGGAHFLRGIMAYPKLGSAVVGVGTDALRVIFDSTNPRTVEVGRLQQNDAIPAYVNIDEVVHKHFAIVGSTGAGKSTALALIVRKIMTAREDMRVLIIDAHNEYAACFDDHAEVLGPDNLHLPFWLFNFDEIVQIIFGSKKLAEREIALLAELIPLAKSEYARSRNVLRTSYRAPAADDRRYAVDSPVPYRFEDLIALAESRMGKLENGDVAVAYQRLLIRIEAARKNPRYAFIFEDGDGGDTMAGVLSQVLRLQDDGKPMSILQLAGFPAETMEVVVSVLFRLAFEFGVWSDGLSPLLIVCEEAHNYANADRSAGFLPARDGLSRIAKEGRKHGIFLGLVTQRPHQLDSTLISQCSTVFAMRLGHEDDQKIVRAAVSDSAMRQLAFLPALGTREALVMGAAVPTVMRLRFEELPERFIPHSWATGEGKLGADRLIDDRMIETVVARWRGTAMSIKPTLTPQPAALDLRLRAETAQWPPQVHRR